MLTVRTGDVEVDMVCYPYPLLEDPEPGPEGFAVARLRDLSTMKLAAIAKRGTYRDFWDLYEILCKSDISLDEVLDGYVLRFGIVASDLYHVVRSLTYFGDAAAEMMMPRGMTRDLWRRITAFFEQQVPAVARRRLEED
jgi:hypothetical protein